jgi:hypothetical protein
MDGQGSNNKPVVPIQTNSFFQSANKFKTCFQRVELKVSEKFSLPADSSYFRKLIVVIIGERYMLRMENLH